MRAPLQNWNKKHQEGNILIMASIVLSTAIILLASIDIGFLFYQKRELQKIADMAAIAGAQQLAKVDGCELAPSFAINNAQTPEHNFPLEPTVTIGIWHPTIQNPQHFQGTGCVDSPNAVRVEVNRTFGSFFGAWASQSVHASAIATSSEPMAVFSVGSRLLRIENGAVPGLLSAIGVNIDNTRLVSYDGLANASVKPSGLLRELGISIPLGADIGKIREIVSVDTSSGCANGFCPLGVLLGAVKVGEDDQTLDVSSLGLSAEQLALNVKLLSDENGRGLFAFLETANGNAALNTNINTLDFVTAAIGAANSHRGIPLNLNVNVPGLVNNEMKIGIVEPPSIGVGGKGTKAYTSQIRIFNHVKANLSPVLSVNLPIGIDVVNGWANIIEICGKDSNGNNTVVFEVNAPLLHTCVGGIATNDPFSTKDMCTTNVSTTDMLNVLGLLKLNASFTLDALPSPTPLPILTLSLEEKPSDIIGNDFLVDTTIKNLTDAVLATVLGQLLNQKQGGVNNENLASGLLAVTGNTLKTSVETLETSLNSLKSFVNSLDDATKEILEGSLSSSIINLLSGIGNLLNGLLASVGNLLKNLLGNVGCLLSGQYNQCMLQNQLAGAQTSAGQSISNVLLSLLGLVTDLLEPVLNNVGNVLENQLQAIFGAHLQEVEVTLHDLQCGGGSNVRLVH